MLNSLKNFLKDLPSGFEVKEELRFTCPWGVVYSLLHPRALSKKCPLIFNSFFMVSSMAFINWNSVLEGMKPVFCLIILAVCIADSHFILECGIHYIGGFPGGSGIKKIHLPVRRHGFDSWVRKIPWRRKWQLQYSCLEKPHRQGSLADSPWGRQRIGHYLVTKTPPPPIV